MDAVESGIGRTRQRSTFRAAQKERTRLALREAAIALFASKGYSATTIDDITTAVGASRGTFYIHFESKARIVAEVVEDRIVPETLEFYQRLDAVYDQGKGALRDWLGDAIGFFERHHEVLVFADEAFSVESDLEELSVPRLLDRCAAVMPRYLGQYKGRKRQQAQLRLELLILQISMFSRLWVSGRWPVKRDIVLDVLLDLWTHGLRGDGAAAAPPPMTI